MLKVKLLHPDAKAPTVAHPGQDLGYDVFSLEDYFIPALSQAMIRTGVAIEFDPPAGARIETKSSMAKIYASTEGSVIDASYRGEIIVILYNRHPVATLEIKKGSKVAQLVKNPHMADNVQVVDELNPSKRGEKGFGSTGAY